MCNSVVNKMDISINGRKIEEVDSYIYLRQMVTKDHDQELELRCRISLGWTAFGKLDSIMWNKSIPLRFKMKVHNEYIHPVITYGSETWSLSKTQLQKMVTTQYKMEWIVMGLSLHDRKSANWICSDRHHWNYPPNLCQQAPMGRACLMAERQQVDKMCDRSETKPWQWLCYHNKIMLWYRWVPLKPDFLGAWKSVRLKHNLAYPVDVTFFDIAHMFLFTLLHSVSRITHALASKYYGPYNQLKLKSALKCFISAIWYLYHIRNLILLTLIAL